MIDKTQKSEKTEGDETVMMESMSSEPASAARNMKM